ncbi:MAG: LysR family transcriptional regulator [Coriobacteriaceae bacterium]|nr:LysR family transcriptional regulator [Coriobacteriaceae bacterium]
MNFTSLGYFEVLARERNFTRAAEKLHITQQSLSSNIAKMERELGCQLIVRHVPLDLTYAGEVLLRYAATFREERDQMLQEFADISQNQRGILRIGIAYTRGRTILPDVILEFQKRFPLIQVQLIEDSNDVLHRKLIDGDVDLAIANFSDSLPGITLHEFYREEVVLLVARGLFESLYGDEADKRVRLFEEGDYSALADCPLILGGMDDLDGQIARNVLKREGIAHPHIVASSSNAETQLALAIRGVGACFCPVILARAALTEEQLSSLITLHLGETARYRIRFGCQDRSYQWSVIEAFMDVAKQIVHD